MALTVDSDSKYMVYIESNQRLSGSSHDFLIIYETPSNTEFDSMCCISASIPKSFYMVDSGFNTFQISEDGGSTFVTITAPVGNYNVNSFITTMVGLMKPPNTTNTYTITYPNALTSADTGKFTFATTGVLANQPIFRFINKFGFNVQMGFGISNTNPSQNTDYTFTANSLTSTNVINMQPSKEIYISCDSVNDGFSNILQNIPNDNVPSMGVATYFQNSVEANSKPYTKGKDNIFRFRIIDEYLDDINLNGLDWTGQFLLYKKQTLINRLKTFISGLVSKTGRK